MNCSLHFIQHVIRHGNSFVDWHSHPIYEIVYYRSGGGTTEFNGSRYHYTPGSFAILSPNEPHNEHRSSQTEVVYFCYECRSGAPDLPTGFYQDSSGSILRWIDQMLAEMDGKKTNYEAAINSLLHLLLVEAQRLTGAHSPLPRNRQIRYAQRYMEQYYNQKLQLSQVADMCGYSYDHFRHIFKETTGLTPTQYTRRLRVDKSKEMILGNPDKSLTQIALDCGFSSLSQYSSVFRQVTGQTPSDFIQQQC